LSFFPPSSYAKELPAPIKAVANNARSNKATPQKKRVFELGFVSPYVPFCFIGGGVAPLADDSHRDSEQRHDRLRRVGVDYVRNDDYRRQQAGVLFGQERK
jgi:hypothetical protein